MRHNTLQGRFFALTLLLLLLSIALISVIGVETLKQTLYSESETRQLNHTRTLAALYPEDPETDPGAYAAKARGDTAIRITVIDRDGRVLADTERDPFLLNNHADRPEIRKAWAEGYGISRRYSETLTEYLVYTAVRIPGRDMIIRAASPVTAIKVIITRSYLRIAAAGLLILTLAGTLYLFIGKRLNRFFASVNRISGRYARGDFSERIPNAGGTWDLRELSETLNAMARQLRERINTVNQQKAELKMMLDNIADPVILLDGRLMIRDMNPAAVTVFRRQLRESLGRSIIQVIPNIALCELAEETLRTGVTRTGIIRLEGIAPRYFTAKSTPLYTPGAENDGLLIVLNDITGMKRVNDMRRDFVANISHELKTPITAITGYVETLESIPEPTPERRRDFIRIIREQSTRLNAIVNELLTLSALEEENRPPEREPVPVEDLLASAVSACESAAEKKGIGFETDLRYTGDILVNPLLAEQCLVNLLDNAIKYSDRDRNVRIDCEKLDDEIRFSVTDSGWGIPVQDQERIFERFYRVDKARSRDMGGTGLGLAIVKHAMALLGGHVELESELGKGSTFRLIFPQ